MFQASFVSSIMSLDQGYSEKDYVQVQVLPYHTISHHDNKNTQTNTYNSLSTITYLEPKLPAFFQNQSYSKPDPVLPAGYKQDPADLLFESLLDHKNNHANLFDNHADLCGYMHVSQSYAIVDSYRILEPHELPQSVQVLSDDTSA